MAHKLIDLNAWPPSSGIRSSGLIGRSVNEGGSKVSEAAGGPNTTLFLLPVDLGVELLDPSQELYLPWAPMFPTIMVMD